MVFGKFQYRKIFRNKIFLFFVFKENEGQMNTPANHDINVIPAWLAGYSGKGITISIIDDGLDHKHPELIDRYVSIKIYLFVLFFLGEKIKFIF
jgi:subtilisin family serine protease